MIRKIREIPVSEHSYTFEAATKTPQFREKGYEEKEYFLYGTANVYHWENGEAAVKYADVPYVNRMVVRRPADPAGFSGNVVVEILNSTSNFDVDRVWYLTQDYMMDHGDIYIGITSKPNVLKALKQFNSERYGELTWDFTDQNPDQAEVKFLGNLAGASAVGTEDGLFWDMLMDLADYLRTPDNELLQGYGKYYQYLAGWSQPGGYMNRFLKTFAYSGERENSYFDGYFSCGSAVSLMPDLNQSYGPTGEALTEKLEKITEPFVDVHTESENQLWGNHVLRGRNSDRPDFLYRVYDIAGATHDSKESLLECYRDDADLEKCGISFQYPGVEDHPNDFPYHLVFHSALDALYRWVREGVAPMVLPRIEADPELKNWTDATGNAVGGWRLPMIVYPLAVYHPVCEPSAPENAFGASLFGYVEPYSTEKAVALYGSAEHYMKLVEEEAQRCVKDGRLLARDVQECLDCCKKAVSECGLDKV